MKTPEEIKRGLKCCNEDDQECGLCPYIDQCSVGIPCEMGHDALAYIEQLEQEVERLRKRIVFWRSEIGRPPVIRCKECVHRMMSKREPTFMWCPAHPCWRNYNPDGYGEKGQSK